MTREEIIHGLLLLRNTVESDEDFEIFDSSIKALKREPRWIPVTERLPKNGGRYLVNYSSGYVATAYYYELGLKWNSATTERIIAWMPLPEPYKEDKEGNT